MSNHEPNTPTSGNTTPDHHSPLAPAETVTQVKPLVIAPLGSGTNADITEGGTLPQNPDEAGHAARLSQETAARHPPTVPGYQLLSELGRGGMGVVYRALQTRLNRPTAIKMLLGGQFADPIASVRFLVEAEVVAQIQHPNVVQVFEFGQADGQPFFALEFLTGGTLSGKLQNAGRFAPRDAAEMVAKLADGIAAAHAKGIVHRDLKPANVLIDDHGEPKVTDFGLAKVGTSDMTATGAIMGTPSYMSPEQAAGKTKEVGTTTDVYALGTILYELLAGRVPFKGDTVMETIHHVLTREPVRLRVAVPNIPRDLETICLKCLEKEPKKRYSTAEALATDLRAFLGGRPITARPVGSVERMVKWMKRNPGRAAGIAASMLVLVGFGVSANEVRKQREDDRFAAEKQRADDRIAAEEKRLADLRSTRADALVESLSEADTNRTQHIISELADFRQLARSKLQKLAVQPITKKPGLHARLALLDEEPARATELAAYLKVCRPEELLSIRQALKPHAATVSPSLWELLSDEKTEAGQRVRAASALAGWNAEDHRWSAVAGSLSESVVRANPVEFVVWAEALEPVRGSLVPALVKRYPQSRYRIRTGKLDESDLVAEASSFDLTANLLARFTTDRPGDLAEMAMTVDARHHKLFAEAVKQKSGAVVPVLKAELAKVVVPDWHDSPLNPTWKEVAAETVKQIETAEGLVHDRFAFVQAIPLAEFESLANVLTPSGYRPVRVRPYVTDGRVMIAAVWQRDGVAWKFLSGADAEAVRRKDDHLRLDGFQPVDVAAWLDQDAKPILIEPFAALLGGAGGSCVVGKPAFRFAAVWEAAPNEKPVSRLYLAGGGTVGHRAEFTAFEKAKLWPKTVQAVGVRGVGTWYSGVFGDAPEGAVLSWSLTPATYLAGKANQVAVDFAMFPDSLGTQKYAAIWHNKLAVEVERLIGLTVEEHRKKSQELAAAGWRLVALGVAAPNTASSVWHRTFTQDAAVDMLAKRQANAATVLMTLGETESVWPLLKFPKDDDPSVRSYLLQRLAAIGADPEALVRRFDSETDVSAKRAVLIALGDFPPEAVPVAEREQFTMRLLGLYREHPDPGLHSAINWLLRQQWDKAKEVAAIDAELTSAARAKVIASGPLHFGPLLPAPTVGKDKDWFVNGEGQTYTVVRGPVQFTRGSPLSEPGRLYGEATIRRRIGRSFSISTKEVTIAEFFRFQPKHLWTERISPDADTPVVTVTWYDAAGYCNWLSEREGIPADQWCYEPNEKGAYAEGMKIKDDHLKLRGYRLPIGLEWEFACRAGSVTARYYGRNEELLPRYGWSLKTSEDHAWPVGRLRPNDLGLFDVLGNAMEWVEDPVTTSATDKVDETNAKQSLLINEQSGRMLRGGSFTVPPLNLRSAYRFSNRPGVRNGSVGFRLSKTLLD
ncbi:MAG: SUMF1/EgtB/PvdO family nonheme iron enzyme [Planctomycetes bacterium]|nr:SUMF1/EgtB/PvdO family nonheme iron enzyme [Planctomycetota bacterium]